MSKLKFTLQCVAALILVAFFNLTHVQVATAKHRAVVKATVSSGGENIILTVAGRGSSGFAPPGDGGPALDLKQARL